MDTLVQDNINPIEKVEMSQLIISSTVHNVNPGDLLKGEKQRNRVKAIVPELFLE
jgi:hypothetical protein